MSLAYARGGDAAAGLRLAYRSLLFAVIPSWIVMRLAAQWIASKEGLDDLDEPPAWIDIGFMTSEPTLLLLIVGDGVRRGSRAQSARGRRARLRRSEQDRARAGVHHPAAYVLALWAMSTKPV